MIVPNHEGQIKLGSQARLNASNGGRTIKKPPGARHSRGGLGNLISDMLIKFGRTFWLPTAQQNWAADSRGSNQSSLRAVIGAELA